MAEKLLSLADNVVGKVRIAIFTATMARWCYQNHGSRHLLATSHDDIEELKGKYQ